MEFFFRQVCTQHNCGSLFKLFGRMEVVVEFKTVHPWQVIIEQEQIGLDVSYHLQRLQAINHQKSKVGGLVCQSQVKQLADVWIIFDDKNHFGGGIFFC